MVDWIISLNTHFKCQPETLFRSIQILDRFLSKKVVQLYRFQLVGIGAFLIAVKLEEDLIKLSLAELSNATENTISSDELQYIELIIAETLGYNFLVPTYHDFIPSEIYSDPHVIKHIYDLLEMSLFDYELQLLHSPSEIVGLVNNKLSQCSVIVKNFSM